MIFREIMDLKTESGLPKDLTDKIGAVVKKCRIIEGTCNLFLMGTTAGLTINENDRMLFEDFKRMFDEITDPRRIYHHPENAFSHLRAALLGPSLSIPVSGGKLVLGQWQRIFLWEFDIKPRERKIIVTIHE